MNKISKSSGPARESLYKSLSPVGNSEFGTILKIFRAHNLRLRVEQPKAENNI